MYITNPTTARKQRNRIVAMIPISVRKYGIVERTESGSKIMYEMGEDVTETGMTSL